MQDSVCILDQMSMDETNKQLLNNIHQSRLRHNMRHGVILLTGDQKANKL